MTKCCKNCALCSEIKAGDTTGYCEFWRREVLTKDFCIEYKRKNESEKETE